MDTRPKRVQALADWLERNPGDHDQLTGPNVAKLYTQHGVDVSVRQARRDISDARRVAGLMMEGPGPLPPWTEDLSAADVRRTIRRVLAEDAAPSLQELRRALAEDHGRSATNAELNEFARRVYASLYIQPLVEAAQKTLSSDKNYEDTWRNHDARLKNLDFLHENPFGPDPHSLRLYLIRTTVTLIRDITAQKSTLPRHHLTLMAALRFLRELGDDVTASYAALDDPDDGPGGVTVSRLDQIHVSPS